MRIHMQSFIKQRQGHGTEQGQDKRVVQYTGVDQLTANVIHRTRQREIIQVHGNIPGRGKQTPKRQDKCNPRQAEDKENRQ